ncbi:uncharacterized protein PFLUO_LOCUS3379 [Penicillium psychrofluorescens]|uniref:uncharacterized protein n=1 Tax=Penicillium psychrofluorescens TaxID=3158075 RepID=UPI003CCE1433
MSSTFNRSVLVTGGTTGLGFNCATVIAREHPDYQIIIASRSDPNASADAINQLLGQMNVKFVKLDLSSLSKVRSFVADWKDHRFPPIQSLVLNAALQFPGEAEYTEDGFEKTFAISHVGHALLFFLLTPHLADHARVVNVASGVHDPQQKTGLPDANYISAEELAHPPLALAKANGRQHYTNTKLANVLYTYALHRRFQSIKESTGKNWTVTAFDPGLMPGTGLARDASRVEKFIWFRILPCITPLLRLFLSPNVHTAQVSGNCLAQLAIASDVDGVSGVYFEGNKKIKSSQASYDESKQEDLWQWTIGTLAQSEEEKNAFSMVG